MSLLRPYFPNPYESDNIIYVVLHVMTGGRDLDMTNTTLSQTVLNMSTLAQLSYQQGMFSSAVFHTLSLLACIHTCG